jgi:hypothetical protein
MHMFRCHVADIANSTLFFFPFMCGSHFRLHSLVLFLAYIRITNVHTFCYTSGRPVMLWLLWRPMFDPRPVHVAFVVNREALGEVFL